MRREYEMSEAQLATLLEACKPVPYFAVGGSYGNPISPQERANAAWAVLGEEMGFQHMTVEPTNKGNRFFTAEPRVDEGSRK